MSRGSPTAPLHVARKPDGVEPVCLASDPSSRASSRAPPSLGRGTESVLSGRCQSAPWSQACPRTRNRGVGLLPLLPQKSSLIRQVRPSAVGLRGRHAAVRVNCVPVRARIANSLLRKFGPKISQIASFRLLLDAGNQP